MKQDVQLQEGAFLALFSSKFEMSLFGIIMLTRASSMEDPVSPGSQWQTGHSCPLPVNNANYTCTNDGTPSYVVNATTPKQVQLAVNFARNNNIRLVIK